MGTQCRGYFLNGFKGQIGILGDFSREHVITEWNQEKALEVRYKEGIEKGIEKGMEKGMERKQKEFIDLLKSGTSPEEIIKLYDKNGL
ncbi:hypothetical protein FACS1894151_11530 [Spirochaetia bacterium]|nr:hypothetical protein FACS1894151_11530 [Spirochaetia bacterium]